MIRSKLTFLAGAGAGSLLTAAALTLGSAALAARTDAQDPAAPKAKAAAIKYSTQVVFENERVRVKDVTFPPGVPDTGMHTHDLAHVGVILTEGKLVFTEKDGKKETASFSSGSVGFRGPNATHMVANPGAAPMRVIEVELK
ncbi:MAG TPA: cupin domain-containing protein [Luteitalea sp.]|nr:cupin domain-containing protein [Luteitalea sp.]